MKVYLKRDTGRNWVLWWSANGTKFYPIPEKQIQAALDPEPTSLDQKLAKYREKLNHIYKGTIETFEDGEYNRELKTLTLRA
jgi:hypothetical protein